MQPRVSPAPGAAKAALLLSIVLLAGSCKEAGAPESQITITPETLEMVVGDARQFTAIGAAGIVQWSTSNPQVASVVTQTGFVRGLSRGQAVITAASGGASATANVAVMAPPALALSAATIDFAIPLGGSDPPARTVTVSNSGDIAFGGIALGATAYGQGQPTGWLTATASGSTPPVTVTLTARAASLARGTYTAIVPVQAATATNSPQNIAVRFAIQLPASIALSASSVSLAAIPNETKSTSVNVTNGGDAALTGLSVATTYAQGQNWLQATLSSTSAPATLNLVANSAAPLGVGTYNATVRVSSTVAGVAARDLPVQLVVSPGPSIQLTPTAVSVNATNGTNAATQNVAVANGGGGTLSGLTLGTVTYGAGASNWLTAQLAGTAGPTSLSLVFTSATLASGTYTATVPVLSPVASNSPRNLPVTLVVGPPPVIALNPTSVTFSGWAGSTPQGPQAVQITNSASAVSIPGLSVQITYAGASGWLGASFQGGTTATPATLLLQPLTTNLTGGSYSATVTISSSMAGVTPKTVAVQYNVLTWTVNVYPLLSGCSGACHSAAQPSTSGQPQQLYNQLQPYFGNLQCKLFTGTSCTHSVKYGPTTALYQMLSAWMAAGSLFR